MMRVSKGCAGSVLVFIVSVMAGCAFHPPLLLGRAEAELLPGAGTPQLTEVVLSDILNAEQIEHEIRTAFMIAASRTGADGSLSSAAAGAAGAADGAHHDTTAGPEVVIRLDRRPYTRGMRRRHILTLTLQVFHSGHGAVAVVNRRVNDSTPSFVVIRDMTRQALRRALRKLT
ncbi:MAG: hypothetical protein EA428_13420 [Spirochaetaceae bacterium]|nr:MAG: hypothetical protein EA428_13420 [Spirochaetaceae bacterium]